jgi:hypothetical protein
MLYNEQLVLSGEINDVGAPQEQTAARVIVCV